MCITVLTPGGQLGRPLRFDKLEVLASERLVLGRINADFGYEQNRENLVDLEKY